MSDRDFGKDFRLLTGWSPLRWQSRLFERFVSAENPLPRAIDLPTGLGKTSVMPIWFLARRAGARLPRRLVYVVDRRAVVDQATAEAEKIRERNPDIAISTLRGRYADRGDWLRNPSADAIVVGTVDMIGSRLLFSGYGVGRKMRPYHAGLLGADTLLVLDESHLVPPFERLLEQIDARDGYGPPDEKDAFVIPRFRLLPLSATGREVRGDVFRLGPEDHDDPVVRQRLEAKKLLSLLPGAGKLEDALAVEAWRLSGEGTTACRILVYCQGRSVAANVKAAIDDLARRARLEIASELFVGARRVRERERLAERLQALGFMSGGTTSVEWPAFVVATSAGEVGVDLDADHMVMDLVPFERLVQRLGRVNRLGGEHRQSRVVVVDGIDKNLPEELADRARLARSLLERLPHASADEHLAGPGMLGMLRAEDPVAVRAASSPEPLFPALTRPLVDAWSMTSLVQHTGRPEVQPWLRGWVEDPPQTTLVWRAYLPVRADSDPATDAEIADFFEAAPPHLSETLETGTDAVQGWLLDRARRLTKITERGRQNAEGGDRDSVWSASRVVAFALAPSGDQPKAIRLDDLVTAAGSIRAKNDLRRAISGRTIVLDARFGGLAEPDGIFGPKSVASVAVTLDSDEQWQRTVGWRVRTVGAEYETTDPEWQRPHFFDLERDAEGIPQRRLVVEKFHDHTATEDERALSPRRAQLLDEHQQWTAERARRIVDSLQIPAEIGRAIVLAARLHDEGKRARRWQQAFNARGDGIWAKTRGPIRQAILAGYRHEFGSLGWVERCREFTELRPDLKDLVLHLVAAHHGRARPLIETAGCDDAPPSALEGRAREVALRFARLQKRFGPWGLAWLEALIRAADAQASRANDEERHDG